MTCVDEVLPGLRLSGMRRVGCGAVTAASCPGWGVSAAGSYLVGTARGCAGLGCMSGAMLRSSRWTREAAFGEPGWRVIQMFVFRVITREVARAFWGAGVLGYGVGDFG